MIRKRRWGVVISVGLELIAMAVEADDMGVLLVLLPPWRMILWDESKLRPLLSASSIISSPADLLASVLPLIALMAEAPSIDLAMVAAIVHRRHASFWSGVGLESWFLPYRVELLLWGI